ncbi:MAG: hypothetical protein HYS58_03710, partial [Elusimicrobia bacterium]|nr:hypothetical protein [Elusimicrobiota bacterium]
MTELQRPNGFSFPVKKSIPKKPSVLAIDVGTSSLKVGLVNLNGEIVAGPLYQFYSIQSSEP